MTPAAVLSHAKQFCHAFELCHGNGITPLDGRLHPVVPSVVNLAFAIELALKASLISYGPLPGGHGLQQLFMQLPEPDRTFVRSNVPLEEGQFASCLAAVSKAFVEWRYLYEEPGSKSINLEFLMHLWSAASALAEQKRAAQQNKLQKED